MDYFFLQSANAGISLTTPFCRIWVDFLHNQKTMSWSVVSSQLWQKLSVDSLASHPDYMVSTHRHPDHHSQELNMIALGTWPDSTILEHDLKTENFSIEFFRTTHEGRQFKDYPHNCIFYSDSMVSVCFAGDTKVGDAEFLGLLNSRAKFPDIIVLPFPWITTTRGRLNVLETLSSAKLIINHIPFVEDDEFGFRTKVEEAALLLREKVDLTIMFEPLEKKFFSF